MTTFTELVILREEERVLMKIASKLNDQLNRLKVEELALNSMIRKSNTDKQLQTENKPQASAKTHTRRKATEMAKHTVDNQRQLNLNVTSTWHGAGEAEQEYDEEDNAEEMETEEAMKHDQLTAFLEQMELQYQK